ncbi:MAG: saccharopine dehydrogenase [Bacteroidia bacterium]|nr:MAG: saccharopine dehydrogenase [Bacteroidia bacterium]
MKKIIVLGAGMVGSAIAKELSKKHQVTSIDLDKNALDLLSGKSNIRTEILDVTDETATASAIKDSDLVISAVPGYIGLQTMIQVIKQKKDLVDISFMPEDVQYLDSLAKKNNVTVVMDCGIAPGMPNYIAGYHNEIMKIDGIEYMVGGLPKTRTFPFEYKAPFSPCDVIEEYMRPARYMENGNIVVRPAMSEPEYVHFDTIGTLEAFNTDGLRSLIYTMKQIPDIKEKTLRYPGHIKLIQALKSAGFFDRKPIAVNGFKVSPFDFTSRILFNAWKPDEEEHEFTIMRIILRGTDKGVSKEIIYELYDEFDPKEKISSMARTTGFTATGTAEMIINKVLTEKGVFPPEMVGKNRVCFEYIINYLKARNIQFKVTERNISLPQPADLDPQD